MRLRLKAQPEELAEYGHVLLEQMACALDSANPPLAESLRKAADRLPAPEKPLKYAVLQGLHVATQQRYARRLRQMQAEINEVIDEAARHGGLGPKKIKRRPIVRDTDHTYELAKKDKDKYDTVRRLLKTQGYKDVDFEKNGRLYGKSTNELIDLAEASSNTR